MLTLAALKLLSSKLPKLHKGLVKLQRLFKHPSLYAKRNIFMRIYFGAFKQKVFELELDHSLVSHAVTVRYIMLKYQLSASNCHILTT